MHYSRNDLKKHLAEEHNISPISTHLQEIVYGGTDGIITTFAVVAGFAGAQGSTNVAGLGYMTVLLFGLANLFADASSMGLGNFLALRAEHDRYKREREKEMHEIKYNTEMEKAETRQLLEDRGFNTETADQLVEIYATNSHYWANFMMQYELQMGDPDATSPYFAAFATFVSFQMFGIIPLIPYIFFGSHPHVFLYAIMATIIALLILGSLRWQITKQSISRSIGEVILMGSISATIAYIIGSLFKL